MKLNRLLILAIALVFSLTNYANDHKDLTAGFMMGDPEIKSINAMAFGPQNILFIGDSKSASVVAVELQEESLGEKPNTINLPNIDEKIAAITGSNVDDISIQDMVVNPASGMIYLAIHTGDNQPALFMTDGKELKHVPLTSVRYSQSGLSNPVKEDAQDRRGRSLRRWAISDLKYHDGEVMLSGLSNEEFKSTFRSIPFPFEQNEQYASLEIYHAAHGQYETHSPIKTFMPFELNGSKHLVASYTCTPLVIFPIDGMEQGQHLKGKTVAELGNRNTPLDIISYNKGDNTYFLLANSSRALMRIDVNKVASFSNYLSTPVSESSGTAGVDFIALPYVNVQHLDEYNEGNVLMVQRTSKGDLNLNTVSKRRL